MDTQDIGDALAVISITWFIFVLAFMIAVWGHVAALRKRYAPQAEQILWETSGRQYAVGVSLAQPMYAVWQRGADRPVAVYPFAMEGREAAVAQQRTLEATGSGGAAPPTPV